jgi:hypothetical protein
MPSHPRQTRLLIQIEPDQLDAIAAYQRAEHLATRTGAIRRLINAGLAAIRDSPDGAGGLTLEEVRRAVESAEVAR